LHQRSNFSPLVAIPSVRFQQDSVLLWHLQASFASIQVQVVLAGTPASSCALSRLKRCSCQGRKGMDACITGAWRHAAVQEPRPTSGTCCAQQVRPCALTHIGAPCSDSDGARLSPKGSSGAMLHTTTTVSTRQRTSALHPPVFSVTFNAFFHLRRHCARRERAHMAMGPICAYGRSAIARLLRAPACCPWSPARTQ
jgi:hypothetical protein